MTRLERLKAADSARATGLRYADIGRFDKAIICFTAAHKAERKETQYGDFEVTTPPKKETLS